MKQKKLKGYVLPTLYVVILMVIFGTVSLISTLMQTNPNYLYSVGIMSNETMPVVETEGGITSIIKPYLDESISIATYFYDTESDEETQEKSLIYFENTYMKNTGILYKNTAEFDCVATLNGTVSKVYEDELLGNVVEVDHNTNLKTVYYSLDKVNVKVGDIVGQGEILGTSGTSRLTQDYYTLLFEVYYNGILLNPIEFYEMDPTTLN